MSAGPRRVLLLATTTGYQTRMFGEAASRLGVELIYATNRCDQIEDPWGDGALAVRYHEESRSVDAVLKALEARPVNGVLAVGDRPTVLAAYLARLLGLPGHPPEAARAARDKRLTRERLKAGGFLAPAFISVAADADAAAVLLKVALPAVIKPTVLSGSRGVIRADDAAGFTAAFDRVKKLLASPEVRELRDADAGVIQIETYIPGVEYALEGILEHGALRTLAMFDKPDPLEGPFFEETIYVTPSRATASTRLRIESEVAGAARALGLYHGPIHAECRVNARGVYVLEVAARPIGGLCAKTLRFTPATGAPIGLEELLLRHAMGESTAGWERESAASAVMMIPIPRGGIYRRVEGVDEATAIAGVDEVRMTAKPDQQLHPLPEGASYLGFIFARAATPEAAEQAVRSAHGCLRFTIDPLLTVTSK
ncbi:MAG: ATP-grasp domain-containing protein [Acidobacteriota bacterium]|nr:ATP-grasp domain-containing protein [Acidobacteriota bacterium]